jgi:glycosyltransferase involved in cell wall biosynthesis
MRIVHILNHVQEIGNGIVNVAIDIACLQAKTGHNVAVISSGGEYERLLADYGVKHYRLKLKRNPISIIKAMNAYRGIIEQFEPDIVHAHMMTGVVLASLLRFGYNYALVSTVHNEFQRIATLMGWADRVIAVSQAVAESMEKRGINKDKLLVVSNGIIGSPRTLLMRDNLPVNLQHPAIATVAGMYKRKGISELIAAFAKIAVEFPAAHLYLVGEGPDRKLFEAQARATNCAERIHFEGFQKQPQRYLVSTDIFVMPSYYESFGLAIAEAREAGCAIVASDVDGISQTLDGGEAGILVPPRDSDTLAATLSKLLNDTDMLNKWKNHAQQNLEWLSIARVNQETLAVYSQLITKFNQPNENPSSIYLTESKLTLTNASEKNRAA